MALTQQNRRTRHAYAFLFAAAAATPALAANTPLTWNGGNGTAGADVSGIWDISSPNWSDGTTNNLAWNNTTGGTTNALFGAGTDVSVGNEYAITVGDPITVGAIKFNNSGYTLSATTAKAITLKGDASLINTPTVVVAAGKSATIGSNVTLGGGYVTLTGGGTLNFSGGNINIPLYYQIFVQGGSTLNVQSGSTVFVNNAVTVGNLNNGSRFDGTRDTLIVSGGSFTGGTFSIGKGDATNCTFTVSNGSATIGNLLVFSPGTVADSTNINLTGGTLSAASVQAQTGGLGKSFVNFDGGTFRPTASNDSFWNASSRITANVKAGGATIDTQAFDITIAQPLVHFADLGATPDGGLTKAGTGVLTLAGANTYTGKTHIQGGTLNVTGSLDNTAVIVGTTAAGSGTLGGSGSIGPAASSTASVAVNSGGTLAPGAASNTGGTNVAGNIATLTLNGTLGTADANDFGIASFDLDKTGGLLTNDSVIGLLSAPSFAGGTLQLQLTGTDFAAGDTWNLFDWTGGPVTSPFAAVQSDTSLPSGLVWDTSNLYTTGEISLTSVPEPTTAGLAVLGVGFLLGRRRARRSGHSGAC